MMVSTARMHWHPQTHSVHDEDTCTTFVLVTFASSLASTRLSPLLIHHIPYSNQFPPVTRQICLPGFQVFSPLHLCCKLTAAAFLHTAHAHSTDQHSALHPFLTCPSLPVIETNRRHQHNGEGNSSPQTPNHHLLLSHS